MIIDILSDLHFDLYFKLNNISKTDVQKIYDPFFLRDNGVGDVLVVAGDLGHYNSQNITLLKMIKQIYGYKHIVCILGNHDYFLNSKDEQDKYDKNSFNRVEEMREMINAEDNMYCLDGTIIEIDGIKFGGCDSSYSNAYLKKYYPQDDHPESNNEMWKSCMPDYKGIFGINQYDQLYKLESPKIEAVYKKCDVMITHINPSYLHHHLSPVYNRQQGNMFFSFDGHRYLSEGSMKYWIFGHTHDDIEYEYEGVKCICNPLGSPNQSFHLLNKLVKRIEL